MSKKKEKAAQELTRWFNDIHYSSGMLIDDCAPQFCKGCGEGAWLIPDIKHKRGCGVAKAEKNLAILKE